MYRHWQPVLRMYITPFMTARMSTRRLPPPRLAGGINGFVQRHPRVSIDVQLLDRVVNLVEEGIDVGVRIGSLEDSSLVARPVGTMRRVTVAAPSYLAEHGVPRQPKELLSHNCVRFASGGMMEWAYRVNGKPVTLHVQGNLSVNQTAVGAQACVAGLGIGVFFAYQVAPFVASGALRVLLGGFEMPARPIHLVYPQARLLPMRTRAFIEHMQEHLANEQPRWQLAEPKPAPRARALKPRA